MTPELLSQDQTPRGGTWVGTGEGSLRPWPGRGTEEEDRGATCCGAVGGRSGVCEQGRVAAASPHPESCTRRAVPEQEL